MIKALLSGATLALAACGASGPDAVSINQVTIGAATYPVMPAGSGAWRVMIDGQPVACRTPDADACYWSARNYLQSRAALDDQG